MNDESKSRVQLDSSGNLILVPRVENQAEQEAKNAVRSIVLSCIPEVRKKFLEQTVVLKARVEAEGLLLRSAHQEFIEDWNNFVEQAKEGVVDENDFRDFRNKIIPKILDLRSKLQISPESFSPLLESLDQILNYADTDLNPFLQVLSQIIASCERINLEADLADIDAFPNTLLIDPASTANPNHDYLTSNQNIPRDVDLLMTNEPFSPNASRFRWGISIKGTQLDFHILDLSVQRAHHSHLSSRNDGLRPLNVIATIFEEILKEKFAIVKE